ncbi:YHYH protein [Hoeflea sp. IMCC20628]|uniref:YHYH protein n=1 Tax=Hoeflea sp. IMCC20628 TaxID=1620421 RepID=UPI00063BF518|nr:YHYH protein [Hoeflea sp. IMCC20628]AKH99956.1 YHYH protein [Hoeflea sp. IMCC20628]
MTSFNALGLKTALIAGLVVCGTAAVAQTSNDSITQASAFFASADLVGEPKIVDCTLSQGAQTKCLSITVKADPQSYTPGPWCPSNIADGAEAGGIWLKDGEVHDVDGSFIKNLAELYGDAKWQLYDPDTGNVRFTGTLQACQAAARPDVDPAYQNYCVQCLPEYMPEDATMTYVIPVEPQAASQSQPTNFSGSGVAYNGIRLDGPAPLDAILAAHTIAPFDDCGGHVNPHVGYHYHAVTDCLQQSPATYGPVTAEHGTQIGIAMDGFQILSHQTAAGTDPDDLDSCNGHQSEGLAYHYHAGTAGSNAILGCLTAQAGCVFEDDTAICDASVRPPRP